MNTFTTYIEFNTKRSFGCIGIISRQIFFKFFFLNLKVFNHSRGVGKGAGGWKSFLFKQMWKHFEFQPLFNHFFGGGKGGEYYIFWSKHCFLFLMIQTNLKEFWITTTFNHFWGGVQRVGCALKRVRAFNFWVNHLVSYVLIIQTIVKEFWV